MENKSATRIGCCRLHGFALLVDDGDIFPSQAALAAIDSSITIAIIPDFSGHHDIKVKDVELKVADIGILLNHFRQSRAADHVEIPSVQIILIPEAIAVAQARELIDENALEGGAD